MKKTFTKKASLVTSVVSAFILTLFVSSCASKADFSTSSIVPAARGSVKVKQDKNNNYEIDVEVKHLAEPKRLQTPKEVYIVWIEGADNSVQNIGQLKTSTRGFSSTLKASMSAISPFEPTRVFITAEDQATIQYPSTYIVLDANSF